MLLLCLWAKLSHIDLFSFSVLPIDDSLLSAHLLLTNMIIPIMNQKTLKKTYT